MNKLISLISVMVLIFSLVPSVFTVTAEGNIVTVGAEGDYTTLVDAISASTSGDIIKLLEDRDELVLNIDKTITVDLNGFTLTALKSRLFQNTTTAQNTTLIVKNGTLVTAKRNNVDTGAAENFGNLIFTRATNSFTLDSVKVTSTVDKAGDTALGALFNFTTSSVTRTKIVINNSEISHTGSSGYVLKFYNTDDNYDISITDSIIKAAKDPVYATKGTFEIANSTIETTSERIGSASESGHYATLTIADGQMIKAYDKDGVVTEYKTVDEITNFKNSINSTVANGGKEYYKVKFLNNNITEAIATETTASIRLNEQNGIRFYTKVDEEALADLTGGADYEIGTIVAPADLIGDDGELTADDDCQVIPFKARTAGGNIEYFNAENKEIAGSLVAIKDGNISRDFMARAYVKFGETYYYSATTSTRSLQTVAIAMQNDTASFSQLSEAQQAMVNAWAAGNPATVE